MYNEDQIDARAETYKEDRLIARGGSGGNVPAGALAKDAPLKRALRTTEKLLQTLGAELDSLQAQVAPLTSPGVESEKMAEQTVPHVGDSSIVRGVVDFNNIIEEYIKKIARLRGSLEI